MSFLIKHLFTEKNTHIGGEVKFGFFHIPMHRELYVTREVRQRFKVWGIPLKTTTQLDMVNVPVEIVSLMDTCLELENLEDLDVEAYRKDSLKKAESAKKNLMKAVEETHELNLTQKNDMMQEMFEDDKRLKLLFAEPDEDEQKHLYSFMINGYKPIYKTGGGASFTHFLALPVEDRIMFYSVDLIKTPKRYLLANARSFYITKDYMKKFVNFIDEKGVDIL